jgi:hypothetical protein
MKIKLQVQTYNNKTKKSRALLIFNKKVFGVFGVCAHIDPLLVVNMGEWDAKGI